MPSNHLILCCPLLLLPSVFPSIRVFSNEPVLCIKWPKYWSFSCSISTFNEYSGLISSRIDWLDLLAVQGTLKSLLQHQSSKASIDQFINYLTLQSVQFNHIRLFATPWTAARQFSLSITSSQNLPKLMSIELVMPPNHLILCHPLLLLPSIFPSIRVFLNESALRIRWPKYWSFNQHQTFQWTPRTDPLQDGMVGSPCSSRDAQESSPTLQFKSINSLVLSLLYSPSLTSIHDSWKNHSLD